MHIAIAGNIGSGKTTLTRMLSDHYGWHPMYENVEYNPYLDDFYSDIKRWSFNLEVFFLKERFKDILRIAQEEKDVIQDRSIYEGVYVFTKGNYEMGNLSDRDYNTYMSLFQQLMTLVKLPDLMIYLRSSIPHLVGNIRKRGREYEKGIQLDYLEGLNERYEDFITKRYEGRVLIVDVDDIDFLHNPEDFRNIVQKIDSRLFGLFPQL